MSVGDAEAALAGGTARAGGRYSTSWIHQGYMEPQVATAWLEPEGGLVVSSSTQGAFSTRQQLADLLGWPHDRVRVRAAPLGGAFGGKLMIAEPLAAAACVRLERPVRLALTRIEDFAASNPAPGELIELEAGATAEGDLTGVRGRIVLDRGSNDEFGFEALAAHARLGPVSLAGARRRLLRRADEPRRLRRLSRAVARRRRPSPSRRSSTSWPPSWASTRSSCACATCCARATRGSTASPSRSSAPPSAWSACARTRCGSTAARCPTARASASRSAGGPAGSSPRPRAAAWTPTAS